MSESRPPTPETLEVKRRGRHRLIGAIALVLMLVVFVPMILDSEPRKVVKDVALTIPAKEGLPALPAPSAETPKVEASKADAKPAEPAAPVTTEKPVPAKAVEPAPAPAEKTPEKPAEKVAVAEKKVPEKKVAVAEKLEGFAIQLGAFSDADKLAALRTKMKAAKVPVFTEDVKAASGKLTRLRAGPYKTREQAEKALAQVKKQGVDGKVVPLP